MGSKYASEIAILKNVEKKVEWSGVELSPPSVKFQAILQALQPRIIFLHLIATGLTGCDLVGNVGSLPVKRVEVLAKNRVANQLKMSLDLLNCLYSLAFHKVCTK